jgi:hypothetical protein
MDHSLLVTLGRRKDHFVEVGRHAYALVGTDLTALPPVDALPPRVKPKRDRSGPPLWQPLLRWMAQHPGAHTVAELAEAAQGAHWVKHGEIYQAVLVCCCRRPETFKEVAHHTFALVEGTPLLPEPAAHKARAKRARPDDLGLHVDDPPETLAAPSAGRLVRRRPGGEEVEVPVPTEEQLHPDPAHAPLATSGATDLPHLVADWMRAAPGPHTLDDITVAGIEHQWPVKGPLRRALERVVRRETDLFAEIRPGHYILRS